MVLTPTMTLTAMVKAATATEVRLKERVTARQAMRPSTPNKAPASGRNRRISSIKAAGVKNAPPTRKHISAAKLNNQALIGQCQQQDADEIEQQRGKRDLRQ